MSMHRLERCTSDCTHHLGSSSGGMVLYYYSKVIEGLGINGFQFEYILASGRRIYDNDYYDGLGLCLPRVHIQVNVAKGRRL